MFHKSTSRGPRTNISGAALKSHHGGVRRAICQPSRLIFRMVSRVVLFGKSISGSVALPGWVVRICKHATNIRMLISLAASTPCSERINAAQRSDSIGIVSARHNAETICRPFIKKREKVGSDRSFSICDLAHMASPLYDPDVEKFNNDNSLPLCTLCGRTRAAGIVHGQPRCAQCWLNEHLYSTTMICRFCKKPNAVMHVGRDNDVQACLSCAQERLPISTPCSQCKKRDAEVHTGGRHLCDHCYTDLEFERWLDDRPCKQ